MRALSFSFIFEELIAYVIPSDWSLLDTGSKILEEIAFTALAVAKGAWESL